MPLIPKIPMPYYSIDDTLPTPPTGGNIRINGQVGPIVAQGAETDIFTYTIPANTLTTNGKGLEINFASVITDNTDDHFTRFYLDGTTLLAITADTVVGSAQWKIQIIRYSTTQAWCIMQIWGAGQTGQPNYQTEVVDFTAAIPLKFTGQTLAAGTIQGEILTIDKYI